MRHTPPISPAPATHPAPPGHSPHTSKKYGEIKAKNEKFQAQSVAAYFYVINLQEDVGCGKKEQLPDLIGSDRSSFRNDFPISPAGGSVTYSYRKSTAKF